MKQDRFEACFKSAERAGLLTGLLFDDCMINEWVDGQRGLFETTVLRIAANIFYVNTKPKIARFSKSFK